MHSKGELFHATKDIVPNKFRIWGMGFLKKNGFGKTKSPAAKHANCAGTVCA